MTCIPNASAELLFQHCSYGTLCCATNKRCLIIHINWAILRAKSFALSWFTKTSTSVNAFFSWLKQQRDTAFMYLYHVYARLRFSFQIQEDPESIKLARGLKWKAPGGCKKYSRTSQEPQGRAKRAEHRRYHSTEHPAEDLCDRLQQGIAPEDCEETEDKMIGEAPATWE